MVLIIIPKQIWKDIPEYEGLYQISNTGKVRSLNYRKTDKVKKLKPYKNTSGYLLVTLCKNKKQRKYLIHRLVALAFIPNPDNLPYINHKDENPNNNCVWNLEWCTHEYNSNYGTRNERISESRKGKYLGSKSTWYGYTGTNHPKSKMIFCPELKQIFGGTYEALRLTNVNQSHINECCNKKIKSAGKHPVTGEKLHWFFIEIKKL